MGELDLFDLVEEVGRNFYELMEIDPSASTSDVRKGYKKMALQLHPDKNDAPDADIQFRQLAAVYEVLKDKTTREMYDRVLVEGLPNWKTTAYYFRRMRKIGLAEGLAYVLAIVTVIQYCVNWAAYWERGFTIHENLTQEVRRRQKRLKKDGKTEEDVAKEIGEVEMNMLGPKPTMFDTLPFQLARLTKYLVLLVPAIPGMVREMNAEKQRIKMEKEKEEEEWEEEKRRREEEKEKRKEYKAKRKNAKQYKEATDDDRCILVSPEGPAAEPVVKKAPRNAGQMWTDDDLVELAKQIKKIPGGSSERWDRIAEILERTAVEVTKMAGNIKKNPSLVPISSKSQGVTGREEQRLIGDECLEYEKGDVDSQTATEEEDSDDEEVDEDGYLVLPAAKVEEYVAPEEKKKKKTKGGKQGAEMEKEGEEKGDEEWSQDQQKCLEQALGQFPKGTNERWDRIAGKVDGKGKEQCMARFKVLAEQIKKKKAERST